MAFIYCLHGLAHGSRARGRVPTLNTALTLLLTIFFVDPYPTEQQKQAYGADTNMETDSAPTEAADGDTSLDGVNLPACQKALQLIQQTTWFSHNSISPNVRQCIKILKDLRHRHPAFGAINNWVFLSSIFSPLLFSFSLSIFINNMVHRHSKL